MFGYYYPCKIWWTDNGVLRPVFAGLPFIRLSGPPGTGYAIHGPVDNFTAPNGGALRRGYVSHGCIRMAAEDIVEVYARIHQHPHTSVRVQQEVERDENGRAVDLPRRWIGSECDADVDCNYDGGLCRRTATGAHGTCSRDCTHACPDRPGEGMTFCDGDQTTGAGYCVPASSPTFNNGCARFEDRLMLATDVSRPDGSEHTDVCSPGA
jgi:hypothetical protein